MLRGLCLDYGRKHVISIISCISKCISFISSTPTFMHLNKLLMLANSVMLSISGHGTTRPQASSLGRSPIVDVHDTQYHKL